MSIQLRSATLGAMIISLAMSRPILAQLEITEIMFDSNSAEPAWEWFEVRNTGTQDVDLDGYVLDDFSSSAALTAPNIVASISDTVTTNTVIPAGKVAVLYNGRNLDFAPARFRSAWNLNDNVPLVAVNGWQSLNNGGDAIGIWDSLESYQLDIDNIDEDEDLEVAQFDNTVVSQEFLEGFPSPRGASIEWIGVGDRRLPENWFANDETTAQLSVATSLEDEAINSTNDVGNPGIVIGTGSADALVISEIMYNPASDENAWEWIEVVNGTNVTVDFATNPHILDDSAGGALSEPNINQGSIEAGGIAILYKEGLDVASMQTAWGEEINFIAVNSWPALNNGGDLVGIWEDLESYQIDSSGDSRTDAETVTSVVYEDGSNEWPNVGNGTSISLIDLEGDLNDPLNWILSEEADGSSIFANPVIASQPDHGGGDIGTPGLFLGRTPGCVIPDGLLGDLDGSSDVGFSDFLILSDNFGKEVSTYEEGDIDCSGDVGFSDFLLLSDNFGKKAATAAAVPEPGGFALVCLAGLGFSLRRQRR